MVCSPSLLQLAIAGLVGALVFGAISAGMKLPEVNVFVGSLGKVDLIEY